MELCEHDFKIPKLLNQANKKLKKHKLTFESSDIDFVIVNSLEEKKKLYAEVLESENDGVERENAERMSIPTTGG